MAGWSVPGVVHLGMIREDPVGQRVLARYRMSRKSLVITYVSPELFADTDFRARFGNECARLARVRDARVARFHRYVECDLQDGGCVRGAAVINDHIHGTPLRTLLGTHGAVSAEAALVVLKDMLRALAACHEAGTAHGDVKPENVILTATGQVRLVDAGLWGFTGRQLLARTTPFYLAPELWSGTPASRACGDVYAAAATFFECLVGTPPFYSTEVAELSAKHQGSEPPVDLISEPVRELVVRGLAKDPHSRGEARNFVAFVDDVASRAAGSGWERRGRQELAALLSVPGRRRSGTGWVGYHKPVRLAAVVGGALALAAGLSSPPLVAIPGISISGSGARPPVLVFPDPDRGSTAMRVVTNSPLGERRPVPAARDRTSRGVAGTQLPASPTPGLTGDTASDEHAVRDADHRGAAHPESATPGQFTPVAPACTQQLMDDHKRCIAMDAERLTPGPTAAASDPSEVSVLVSLPIQLPTLIDQPVQLHTPIQRSRFKDVHIPKSLRAQADPQPSVKPLRVNRAEGIGKSAELLTGGPETGFAPAKGAANPENR
jgi:hypothetical protein